MVEKKSQFHKKPAPLPKLYSISTFVDYLQVLKYIHPLLSIELCLIQVTKVGKREENFRTFQSNASVRTLHSELSNGCSGMNELLNFIFIHKYLQRFFSSLILVFLLIINK